PNGDALRKCILEGPYTPTIVTAPAVPATENSLAIPEQTTVEGQYEMTPEIRAILNQKKNRFIDIGTGMGDEIYSTYLQDDEWNMDQKPLQLLRCKVNVQFLQQLQPEWSRFVTIVKQQHKLDEVSYHKLFDILKQYQKEVHELRAERMAKNANISKLLCSIPSKPLLPNIKISQIICINIKSFTSNQISCNYKIQRQRDSQTNHTPSESASEEEVIHDKTQEGERRNKNVDTTPRYKNDNQTGQFRNQRAVNVVGARETVGGLVVQQSGIQCFNCKEFGHYAKECRKPKRLADTDERLYEQELKLFTVTWQRFQEVETGDSNVIPDSPDMCDNDIQDDQNDVECDDERVALANLIANLKLDVDENKKIQKKLKKQMTIYGVSKDVMCSYLQYSSDLDEITELQCLYLHKVRECDCLAQKLSEQTEFVSKEIYTKLLQSFAKLEKHSISLEIALQECQEQLKNDTVCKDKASNVFRKNEEQYFEIKILSSTARQGKSSASKKPKKIDPKELGPECFNKMEPTSDGSAEITLLGPFLCSDDVCHKSSGLALPRTNDFD
ncbi:retrovirus-related pol polyprotein from transposon TNT 1-94, partial [Tanacetum coccineum]